MAAVTLTIDLPTSCLLASENSSCVSSDCATRCLSVGTATGLVVCRYSHWLGSWSGGRERQSELGWRQHWGASLLVGLPAEGLKSDEDERQTRLCSFCSADLGTICLFFGKQQSSNSLCSGPRAHSPLRQTPGGKHGSGPLYNIVPPKPVSNFPQWNLHIG